MDDEVPDFTNKVVVFYLQNPPRTIEDGAVLEFASFKMFGGRLFVVGRIPEFIDSDWASKLPGGVAWDSVVSYLIFASREEYIERVIKTKPSLIRRLIRGESP